MKHTLIALLLGLLVSLPSVAGDDPPKGFEPLFNGKDLAGWKATGKMEVWGAENGVSGEGKKLLDDPKVRALFKKELDHYGEKFKEKDMKDLQHKYARRVE